MSGFFTEGQIGNTLAEREGTDLIPSSTGEVLGAQFGQTFAENPTVRAGRLAARTTLPDGSGTPFQNRFGYNPNPPTLSPEEANERYGVQGRLSFTEPVTEAVARDLHEFHRNSAIREDVIARRGSGIGTGLIARFGVGLVASALDPLNIASAFVPFAGEARVAAMFGSAATGALGRFGVRAVEGAGQGFLGAAALEPLNMWLAAQDRDDYTMGDALVNLAFGTALGGALHGGLGVVRDRAGLPLWSPEMNQAAVRQATAALAEGRTIDAAAAMEFVAARTARQELEAWRASIARADAEVTAATGAADNRAAAMREAADRLAQIKTQLAEVRGERLDVADAKAELGLGPTERRQLREIETQLARTDLPAGERITLELRRLDMLDGADTPRSWASLELARSDAQDTGLAAEEGRLARQEALARARLRQAAERTLQADSLAKQRRLVAQSREATALALGERSIRRMAGRLGVELGEGEALEMASKVMRVGPDNTQAVLDDILNTLSKRAPAGPYLPQDVIVSNATAERIAARAEATLRTREANAEARLASAARGSPDPRDQAADRAAIERAEVTPKVEGTAADELAEAQKATAELEAILAAADKQYAASVANRTIQGGSLNDASIAGLASDVQAHLDAGGTVALHVEGKTVRITGVERGLMVDSQGQRWGAVGALSNTTSRLEMRGVEAKPDPDLVAAAEARKEGEAMGKAFEAAAICQIGGR